MAMFRQSVTGHILLWLKNCLMQYKTSFSYACVMRAANAIKSAFTQSALRNYFVSPSKLEAHYKTSYIYSFANRVLGGISKCATAVARPIWKASDGGILGNTLRKLKAHGLFGIEYLAAVFFALMLLVPHDFWNNVYAFIGALALAALYLVQMQTLPGIGKDTRAISASLIAFILAIFAGMLITPDRGDGIRVALFFFSSVIFTVVCAGGIRSKTALSVFLHILLTGLGVLCLFGIIQRFLGVEVNPEFTDVATNEGMPGRVYATLSNPNNFAEVIVLLAPFAGAMLLNSKGKKAKLFWIALLGVCIAALMMSYSRSCYVAFAIAALLFIALYDWRLLIPLAIIAVLCIPLLPETVMNRILTIGSMEDTSNASRIYIWEGILKMLREHIVTGIGLGPAAFGKLYPLYANPLGLAAPHAHMLYLEVFVELGLLGGISFLTFMFSTVKKALATFNRADSALRNIIIAGIASLGGISFVCAAEYIWFYPRVMFVFWIAVGILLCAIRLSKKEK